MRNQYLVPANSKKSQLIFGFFTWPDLILCLIGAAITIALLIILKNPTTVEFISDLYAPGDYIQYKITIHCSTLLSYKIKG